MGADFAIAAAALLRPGQITAAGSDVAVRIGLFAFNDLEPSVDGHALNPHAAVRERLGIGNGPAIFLRNAIEEIEAAVDQLGRRKHGLALFNQAIVGREKPSAGLAVCDGDFNPLVENWNFTQLSGVILSLKDRFGTGFGAVEGGELRLDVIEGLAG